VTRIGRVAIVLEGPDGIGGPEIARLRSVGYEIVDGFRGSGRVPGRIVCHGVVASDEDAAAAMLAALAGHSLLIEARRRSAAVDRLVDDLRRLGPVDHRILEGRIAEAIRPEARAILALIADGLSLGEAADSLGLSRRTADRRVAEARRALGTDRTTAAVAKARASGWLTPRDG
jgi:DNA-binding NarL/FixJ family response regulator